MLNYVSLKNMALLAKTCSCLQLYSIQPNFLMNLTCGIRGCRLSSAILFWSRGLSVRSIAGFHAQPASLLCQLQYLRISRIITKIWSAKCGLFKCYDRVTKTKEWSMYFILIWFKMAISDGKFKLEYICRYLIRQ